MQAEQGVTSNKATGCCEPLADLRRGVWQPVADSSELRQEFIVSPAERTQADLPASIATPIPLELVWTQFALVLLLHYRGKDTSYTTDLLGQNI